MNDPTWAPRVRAQIDALPATRPGLLTAVLAVEEAARRLVPPEPSSAPGSLLTIWRRCARAADHVRAIASAPSVEPLSLPPLDRAVTQVDLMALRQLIGECCALANEVLDDRRHPLPHGHVLAIGKAQHLLELAAESAVEVAA